MKRLITGILVLIMLASTVAITVFAEPVAPTEPEVEQFRISWGLPYTEASADAILKEEAIQLGRNALQNFFGADFDKLGDYTLEIGYQPGFCLRTSMMESPMMDLDGTLIHFDDLPDDRFPMDVTRSAWVGTVIVPSDRIPCPEGRMLRSSDLFRFTIDSQTGEVIHLQFFPSEDPIARPYMQRECMGMPIDVFNYRDNMTIEHHFEYAQHARQAAETLGIFESAIYRASVLGGGWSMGRDGSFELLIAVALESEDGETATLTFQGRERKELVFVCFFQRMIEHALDREGNVVEPISRFVGICAESEIDWIYFA